MEGLKHYKLNAQKREQVIDELKSQTFDILIIGGGITGAGIALDATTRGFKVALIEKNDFASGTSSRSTKLIHGGLRYLKKFEFKLVKDVGKERAIAYKNAPHLVIPEKMVLPIRKGGTYSKFATSIGLWFYDKLAGVKGTDKRKILSKKDTLNEIPILKEKGLISSGFYAEYRTDDSRLTLEIIKTATNNKALPLNYCKALEPIYEKETIKGVNCIDQISNQSFEIRSKFIVNATGPWSDKLREQDGSLTLKHMHLTKGVHIVVDKEKLPLNHSVYFDVNDGRMIFTIPRLDKIYIGTTDTNYDKDIDRPENTVEDVEYLLNAVNNQFEVELNKKDVLSSWAGLRPLIHEEGKKPGEISRKDEVFISKSGLITIAGGKLTGYRLMAKKVVDHISKIENLNHSCITASIKINGGEFKTPNMVEGFRLNIKSRLKSLGIDEKHANYLVNTYGKQSNAILEIFTQEKHNHLVESEALYGLRYDAIYTLTDFFLRRTGKINFMPEVVLSEIEIVKPIFMDFLNWDENNFEKSKKELVDYFESVTKF